MALERVERYAGRILLEQPDAPRAVRLWAVLARAHTSQQNLVLLVAAAVFVAAAMWLRGAEDVPDKPLLTAVFAVGALVSLGGVVVWAQRIAWALRHGLRCSARISTVRFVPPGPIHAKTLDAMSNGMAMGARRVFHPAGEFREDYRIQASWAGEVAEGDSIEVIVHPRREKVLLDVSRM